MGRTIIIGSAWWIVGFIEVMTGMGTGSLPRMALGIVIWAALVFYLYRKVAKN